MSPAPLLDFSQDKLDREPLADYLTHFITTSQPTTNEDSRVIALNSGWGTGKTSFVNMWMKKLKDADTSSFVCLKYNAWENDDFPDALMPIICSFQQLIDKTTLNGPELKTSLANIVSTFGPKFLGLVTPFTCGVNLEGFAEAYKEYREKKLPDMIFEEFTARQEHKKLFRKLTEAIRGEHEYLLICIDELDRCRPTFAIETLEVVKHFFDLPNVIFVFSLDMKQLHRSIKTVYGDIDSMGYLQRFFDYTMSLPKPDLRMFLMERLIDHEGNPLEIRVSLLEELAERFSISLRTLNVICKEYAHFLERKEMITHTKRQSLPKKYQQAYLALFCMKYADLGLYLDFLQNGTVISDQNDRLWINLFGWRKSTIEEYQSCYTKEVASMPLLAFDQNTNTELEDLLKQTDLHFLNSGTDSLINCYAREFSDITISQAIYNNVEYGCIFPTDSQLNP